MKNWRRHISPFRYFQRSIYRKLLLSYFFVALFTISLLMTDFYFRTAQDLKQQSIDAADRLAQQSAATLESYMSNVRSFAWNYFGDAGFQQFVLHMGQDPEPISYYNSKIARFTYDNAIVSSVYIHKLDGFSIQAGSDANNITEEELARLTKIAIEQEGKGVWVVSRLLDRDTKESVDTLTFVQAIRLISLSSPGPVIGVMTYGLSYAKLQAWMQDIGGGAESGYAIVRSDDGTVVEAPRAMKAANLALSGGELKKMNRNPKSGRFYTSGAKGSSLIVYQKLTDTDWTLVSRLPTNELMKPVNDFTRRTMLIGAASLLVAMAVATWLSSRTVTPLKELSKGMKAIEVGNYDVNLPVRSIDEVGYLSTNFNRMAREINRLIRKVYETEIIKTRAEIKALQLQINPHFLYNTLGIIDSLSSMNGDERVSLISRSLAKMFRYNISGDDISTLRAEVQQIRLYLSIQQIRFDSRLSYSIYLEPGLEEVPIPKLLFQPLVENSILHGISQRVEGGTVRVEAMTSGQTIQIRVWNNGPPIGAEQQALLRRRLQGHVRNGEANAEHASFGLFNVHSRTRLLFGESCGLIFSSSPELGTEFILTIKPTLAQGGITNEHHRA